MARARIFNASRRRRRAMRRKRRPSPFAAKKLPTAGRMVMYREPGYPVAVRKKAVWTYTEGGTINPAIFQGAELRISSDPWDPQFLGASLSHPMATGMDQWENFYDNYFVEKVTIQATFVPTSNSFLTTPAQVYIRWDADRTPMTDIQEVMASKQRRFKGMGIPAAGKGFTTVNATMTPWKLNNLDFSAQVCMGSFETGINQTDSIHHGDPQGFFFVGVHSLIPGEDVQETKVNIRLNYHVVMVNRKAVLPESAYVGP